MARSSAKPVTRSGGPTGSSRGTATVDLGLDPPLARDGDAGSHDRRTVSMRWLSGTVLTGLFGIGLVGAAIYVSMDGQLTFAERGEWASAQAGRQAASDKSSKRGDRLFIATDIVSAKQSFRTPTTIRVGDREVIKVKPFVRVATNLALGTLGFADDVPPFNPMKLYASGGDSGERVQEQPEIAAEGDAEVSVQKRPLLNYSGAPDSGAMLTVEQVEAQVAEERKASLAAGQRALAIPSQLMLTRALNAPRVQPDARPDALGISFSTMQVTIVPENVTTREKSPPVEKKTQATGPDERMVTIKRGETVEQILRANGASPAEAKSALAAMVTRMKDTPPREGQRIKLLFGPSVDGRRPSQLLRVMLLDAEAVLAIAAVNDKDDFVALQPPQQETPVASNEEDDEEEPDTGSGLRLYDSLYETGFKHDIPRNIIDQIVKVAFYDFDLQRRVSGGDSIELFYAEDDENDNRADVLYASLSVGGTLRRYYRFAPSDDGIVDFFDETGKSNRKFLIRKPIAEGQLRSTFGMRYHPILRYSRMHTGVDWANRIGTPIVAAGDGKVRSAGWDSGYGRRVEIEHAYNFVTAYSHMSAFAKGIKDGVRVRQGQVIGYLGNSGLATGPHLHYEVLINDNFVDPLAVKVPRSRDLDDRQLVAFKREKERIDDIMSKAPSATRVAGKS
ncbi:M23 family metallopeptidase [uncultured Alsobacter sp.]|uniref:M23 family metallopeptidase n=1 Tax=uncultured Alsobacter sp. TaxID=1748258 RepID=UPI0025F557D8|nr:M23 family metallopeptidase [uncultured Alsobacter sp.]